MSFLGDDAGVGWFVLNWMVNIFFLSDLVMSFFLAYQEDRDGTTKAWVTDPHHVRQHCTPRRAPSPHTLTTRLASYLVLAPLFSHRLPHRDARLCLHAPAPNRRARCLCDTDLRSWFTLDVLTVIDFQLVAKNVIAGMEGGPFCFYCGGSDDESEGSSDTDALRLVRTLRLFRLVIRCHSASISATTTKFCLPHAQSASVPHAPQNTGLRLSPHWPRCERAACQVKLLHILRASRIITRWQDFYGFSFATLTMIRLITTLAMLLHWFTCVWAFVALQGVPGVSLEGLDTWVKVTLGDDPELGSIYMVGLYVSVVALFGGIGSVGPTNMCEYAVLTFILFSGCFFWAYVISSLCSMLATLNPHGAPRTSRAPAATHRSVHTLG